MRKLIIAGVLLALTVFGIGYVVGQVRGAAPSFAAGNGPTVFTGRDFGPHFLGQGTGGGSIPKHADGTVTAISGNTITIAPDNDANNPNEYASVTTVQLTGSTQYNGAGKSAVKVGSRILAAGTISSDGKTLTASQVWTGGAGGCPHGTHQSGTTPSSGTPGSNA